MSLRPDQLAAYFEARMPGTRLRGKPQVTVRCCFHEDRTASMSINTEKGVWKCHTGCGGGGALDFEMKFSRCDMETAKANISQLLGDRQAFIFAQKPEATYQYHDAAGRLLFEKLRYPGKRFAQRRPTLKGGWEYKLGDAKKPLYHLPEVLVANEIIVCEGEKDADNVRTLNLGDREKGIFVASTCNFDGAGKWRDDYSPYLLGKKVIIFPDNDEPGRKHAEQVARSVYPYVTGVKIVVLPGLPEKGDVSDYLKTHAAADLIMEVTTAAQWHPPIEDDKLLVPSTEFIAGQPETTDWLIEGVIERKANGFFCAVPKGGKSWAAVDMALSLALGCDWLGFPVPRAVKTALISREDNPSLTGWRLHHMFKGKPEQSQDIGKLRQFLYVNSRAQTPELMLDNSEQVEELIRALKRRQIEFAIFDVFNVMHGADENDNTEMRGVLKVLSRIQAEVGCGMGVVHHFNKSDSGSMTQRLRGSSAIAGWAEWLIGIAMAEEETKTRRMDFELKAACPPDSIYYQIVTADSGEVQLKRTEHAPGTQQRQRDNVRFM